MEFAIKKVEVTELLKVSIKFTLDLPEGQKLHKGRFEMDLQDAVRSHVGLPSGDFENISLSKFVGDYVLTVTFEPKPNRSSATLQALVNQHIPQLVQQHSDS